MFTILYEDDALCVVNKPAGLLVIPAHFEKKLSLLELLNKEAAQKTKTYRLHPCHRIDRQASGIVIFAKGKRNQSAIMEQFHAHQVKKHYLAFVKGLLPNQSGTLTHYIKARGKEREKKAILHYRVLEERKLWSFIEVEPLTGRTNQIRMQFANIDHPLLGERIYAFGKDFEVKFRRLALHAHRIYFYHPLGRRPIFLEAPLPSDMKAFLELPQ